MMYYVKTTHTAKANNPTYPEGTVQVGYTGKGGWYADSPKYIKGWSREHFARQYIEKYPSEEKYWDAVDEIVAVEN